MQYSILTEYLDREEEYGIMDTSAMDDSTFTKLKIILMSLLKLRKKFPHVCKADRKKALDDANGNLREATLNLHIQYGSKENPFRITNPTYSE